MKEIEFNEGADLQSVIHALFYDEKDPTSPTYRRKLSRPRIHWWRIVLACLIPLLVAVGLGFGLRWLKLDVWLCAVLPVLALLVYVFLRLRAICKCLVRIYQRYAPEQVRCKCRFEPSCSEYMLQALDRYGAFEGLKRGIRRLKRCKPGNGGTDPLE